MTSNVTVDVLARDLASHVFDSVGRSAEHNSGFLRKFGGAVAGVFTGAALFEGAKELTDFLVESGKAAAEDQESQSRLALQLRNSASATDGQTASVERWITAQGKAVGIADDDLRPALARAATATHSIAAAEDQVSLAMDVSAGRSKSLATVEEALAKARQGNVSGLARLGAVTKDAAGQTLTYDQIVKQLAQTYRGQAADAASTTAGEYRKLGVEVHELEESIGYKLLPVGLALGQWMVGTAVPAAERLGSELADELGPDVQALSQWLSENKDELEGFAKSAGGATLSTLETTAHVVGDLVGFFERLPGPVRTAGAEVLIAGAAWSKLTPLISATSGAITTGVTALGRYSSSLATTEAREDAAAAAGQRFGAAIRNAAGVAGLGLLIDGAHRSNAALSSLEEVAGGAAAGFAVGGPIGGAVGGFGAALFALGQHYRSTANRAQDAYAQIAAIDPVKQADASFANLKATLNQVSGAYTSATRSAVLQDLQSKGTVAAAAQYGVSARTLVDATLGQGAAMQKVGGLVEQYKSHIADLSQQLTHAQGAADIAHARITGYSKAADQAAQEHVTALAKEKKAQEEQLAQLQRGLPAYAADRAEIQKNAVALIDWSGKLKGIPKGVRTDLELGNFDSVTDEIVKLAHQYNLTPKQIQTIVTATGTTDVQGDMKTLQAALRQYDYTHATADVSVDTGNSLATLNNLQNFTFRDKYIHVHTVGGNVGGGTDPAAHGGTGTPGQPPPGSSGRTRAGAIGGQHVQWTAITDDTVTQIVRQHLDVGSRTLLTQLASGLTKGFRPLSKVLDNAKTDLQNKTDAYNAALAEYQSVAGGFSGFQSSIFGTPDQQLTRQEPDGSTTSYTAPATLQQILATGQGNADSAAQLNSDVTKLLGEGLNKQLLLQMQQAGQAGEQNIHTLAMQASLSDIATLNAQQVATDTNLSAAGTAIADKLDGAAVTAAAQNVAVVTALNAILAALQAEKVTSIEVQGAQIVAAITKHKKNQGNGKGGKG